MKAEKARSSDVQVLRRLQSMDWATACISLTPYFFPYKQHNAVSPVSIDVFQLHAVI